MTVPIISKHAREIGISPTVAGLIGKQVILHPGMYFVYWLVYVIPCWLLKYKVHTFL